MNIAEAFYSTYFEEMDVGITVAKMPDGSVLQLSAIGGELTVDFLTEKEFEEEYCYTHTSNDTKS